MPAVRSGRAAARAKPSPARWRLRLGAEVQPDGVRFRVWAPRRREVSVVVEGGRPRETPLVREAGGYFSGLVPGLRPGARYRYRLDGEGPFPDPCSRYQPDGPHGPSLVVDPEAYPWRDAGWPGVALPGQVIYELHVGAFTPEGTFDAAARELPALARMGITLLEVMPVAEFPGRWNWGYDGVGLYAPAHVYGDPDGLKRFVDAAHAAGLGVLLDVVYNHLGPDGNYLPQFSPDYFTDRYECDWGQAINYDGPGSEAVREFVIRNAEYWIAEFHVDGLRLDATQQIFDAGPVHVLAELAGRARRVAGERAVLLVAENEPQDIRHVTPHDRGGFGLDAMWNDDFHHAARVAATGRREAYYTDYRGTPQELISCVRRGFLYQGQRYAWQDNGRGSVVRDEPAARFVQFLENHDQVANTLSGDRIHALTSPGRYRTLTALLLLSPETPMLFMGQEFGAASPFLFFADHAGGLARTVHEGRRDFLAQFPSYGSPGARAEVPAPHAEATFRRSVLDPAGRERHAAIRHLHEDLLRLRREDPVLRRQARDRVDGAVLGDAAFLLRYGGDDAGDRLLLVNLGRDLAYDPAPEPLLAPPSAGGWRLVWSSDDPRYGGPGAVTPCDEAGRWRLPGESAVLMTGGRQ